MKLKSFEKITKIYKPLARLTKGKKKKEGKKEETEDVKYRSCKIDTTEIRRIIRDYE